MSVLRSIIRKRRHGVAQLHRLSGVLSQPNAAFYDLCQTSRTVFVTTYIFARTFSSCSLHSVEINNIRWNVSEACG